MNKECAICLSLGDICVTCEEKAAPMPTAGDVENFGYWCAPKFAPNLGVFHRDILPSTRDHCDVIELVDRAHVTRLQEQCGRLDYDFATVSADLREMTAERDVLKTDLDTWKAAHKRALGINAGVQTELTKARECIVVMSKALLHVRTELDNDMPEDICYATVRKALAHRSAPAAKGVSDE